MLEYADAFACGNPTAIELLKDSAREKKFYDGVIEMLDLMKNGKFTFRDLEEQKTK